MKLVMMVEIQIWEINKSIKAKEYSRLGTWDPPKELKIKSLEFLCNRKRIANQMIIVI